MRIQTLSLVVDAPCNAACPYCVSRMTGKAPERVAWARPADIRNLNKAIMAARIGGATTALITSKGEPTLNPNQVGYYIRMAAEHFPFIEVQTNGLVFMGEESDDLLQRWYDYGLTTLAISVVSHAPEANSDNFAPHLFRYHLDRAVERAHKAGLMVRLTCTMYKGGVETIEQVKQLIDYCTLHKIEQMSFGPVTAPHAAGNDATSEWVREHTLAHGRVQDLYAEVEALGQRLMTLPHGAIIYDVRGVSVCTRECLSIDAYSDEVRQLIFYPNGRLTYDWQYEGAVLL